MLRPGGRFVFFLNHPLLQTPNSGWIDDQTLDPPEQYWRIGPYLVEDETVEEVELGVFIPFIHRPLSRYVNAMAANGLVLGHMDEPAPPPGFLARAEEYAEAASIPRLLLLVAERQHGETPCVRSLAWTSPSTTHPDDLGECHGHRCRTPPPLRRLCAYVGRRGSTHADGAVATSPGGATSYDSPTSARSALS